MHFENIVGKGEHAVFFSSKNKFQLLSYFYFVVCKCFNLDLSKILLFGNRLNTKNTVINHGFEKFLQYLLTLFSKWEVIQVDLKSD